MRSLRFGHGLLLALACGSLASAQATRTWVSGVGDDANPCSRTAPCKTFAGAIAKTAATGEIDVLDPGGFGAVTITKSITIDGGPFIAGVLVSGTNGIVISAGASDVVTLRNLDFNGLNTGLDGVKILAAGTVHLERNLIYQFSQNPIEITTGANVNVTMNDCTIREITQAGVSVTTSAGTASADLDNMRIYTSHPGVRANSNSLVTITDSDISFDAAGVKQVGTPSTVNISGSQISNNTNGLLGFGGATMNASGNTLSQNGTGVSTNGGTIQSDGTNVPLGNTSNGVFNGTPIMKY